MNAPKITTVKGEIVSISQLEKVEITLITVQSLDGEATTFSASNKYWKQVGRFFNLGSIVTAKVEHRVKDTTEYMDATTKKVAKHTSDGVNLANIVAYSPSAWAREISQSLRDDDRNAINSVELERVNALSTYLGMTFGK